MTTSISWTPTQWGSATGGVYTTSTLMDLDAAGTVTGGAIFDAATGQTLTRATVGTQSLVLDPPIISVLSLIIGMNHALGSTSPGTLEIGLVQDSRPANYSNALLPWARGETSLGSFTVTTPGQPSTVTNTLTISSAASTLIRALITSRPNWSGKLALSFRANNTAGTANFRLFHPDPISGINASVTTAQDPFFAGLAGGPMGPHQRYVRDGRFGIPALNTELVQDADNPGLWVRPFDQDPEDEAATYRPRPGEGSVDDGLPDV